MCRTMFRIFAAACLTVVTAHPVWSQPRALTVAGTSPLAPTYDFLLTAAPGGATQTFVAEGSFLRRVTFWFIPGSTLIEEDGSSYGYETRLLVTKGVGLDVNCCGGYEDPNLLFDQVLDPFATGAYTVGFGRGLALEPGEVYSIVLLTDSCIASLCGGPPSYGTFGNPSVEATIEDAYAQGELYGTIFPLIDGDLLAEGDLRFKAVFSTVDEPSTGGLLAIGAVTTLLIGAARRRRYGSAVQPPNSSPFAFAQLSKAELWNRWRTTSG